MFKSKESIFERIINNLNLFVFMIFGVVVIFVLLSNFYHWDKWIVGYVPYVFTTGGIFSNNWMFISVTLYSIVGLGIIGYLFKDKFLNENKKSTNKWYYKNVIFTVLGVYLIFYITNPWYTLQTHPRLFMYQDGKNITNKEIYFFLTERYGFKGDLYKPFKNLEDSIDGLEFAKRIGSKGLYSGIFYDLERFGYGNVIKKYNDLTFQAYFIKKIVEDPFVNDKPLYDSNINIIGNYKKYISNEYIIEAINYIEKIRDDYELKEKNIEFYGEIYDNVLLILKNLYGKGIDNNILPL